MHDLFISYRRADADAVRRFAAALSRAGVSVWLDEQRIEDFASIQHSIEDGLERAKAVLAWYSRAYPASLACQWELTRAFVLAQHEGDVRRRLLVVNPEPDNLHIHPIELRDAHYLAALDNVALDIAAGRVATHVAGLKGVFGAIVESPRPSWHGAAAGEGSSRFVGRLTEMWAIHSGLWQVDAPVIRSGGQRPLVRLTGLGGSGKSLLAETYAIRFGAAYPGGVFWLRAFGHDATLALDAAGRQAQLHGQLVDIALALGTITRDEGVAQLRTMIRDRLDGRGAYLWVVDDLHAAVAWSDVQQWLAPGEAGRTLLTTRAASRGWAGSAIELGALDEASALALLGHARPPADADEAAIAHALVTELFGHPLALELAAAGIVRLGYGAFRARLARPERDALDFSAELMAAQGDNLPHREATNLALSATLMLSVTGLDPAAADLLRLAACVAVAPIARDLAIGALHRCEAISGRGATLDVVADAIDLGIAALQGRSLARGEADGGFAVHGLVSRAIRFREADPARAVAIAEAAVAVLNTALGDDRVFNLRRHREIADIVHHARTLLESGLVGVDEFAWPAPQLLDSLYIHAMEHGDFAYAERAARRLAEHARSTLGETHEHTLTFQGYLGQVLRARGDLAGSLAVHQAVLAERRRRLGERDPATLTSLSDTALTLYALGRHGAAREMQQQVLEGRLEVLGMRHVDTATAMNNLALTLGVLGQEIEVALLLEAQAVALREELLGREHPETVRAHANLAELQRLAGLQKTACGDAEEILCQREASLDADHPDRLLALNNLAAAKYSEGDLAGSRALFADVLACRERALGRHHPLTLATANNLAAVWIGLGEFDTAASSLDRNLVDCREALGRMHPETLKAAWQLLMAETRRGDPHTRVHGLLDEDLAPLVDADPDDLPAELRRLREVLGGS